jgi:transposase InsO family protein
MRSELVVDALQMARWNRQPEPGTIVHADRGAQYTSWIFGHRLREAGLLGSMGRVASSVDNTMMESFWSTMQRELLDRQRWATAPTWPQRSSNGSKASTTRSAATPASTDCPQSTTNTFTTAAAPRHDQHTGRVRRTGSGSVTWSSSVGCSHFLHRTPAPLTTAGSVCGGDTVNCTRGRSPC